MNPFQAMLFWPSSVHQSPTPSTVRMPTRTTTTGKATARRKKGRKGARKAGLKDSKPSQAVPNLPAPQSNRPSPITQLSPEIFERIFAYYLVDRWRNSHHKIALVCRFWKEVLYSSRRLWSFIDLTLKKKRERCIKLSTGVPLQVIWDSRPLSWQRDNATYPCDLMQPFSDRINAITVVDMSSSLQKLHALRVPCLSHLVLEQYHYYDHGRWTVPRVAISLPRSMRKLQTLSLWYVSCSST